MCDAWQASLESIWIFCSLRVCANLLSLQNSLQGAVVCRCSIGSKMLSMHCDNIISSLYLDNIFDPMLHLQAHTISCEVYHSTHRLDRQSHSRCCCCTVCDGPVTATATKEDVQSCCSVLHYGCVSVCCSAIYNWMCRSLECSSNTLLTLSSFMTIAESRHSV